MGSRARILGHCFAVVVSCTVISGSSWACTPHVDTPAPETETEGGADSFLIWTREIVDGESVLVTRWYGRGEDGKAQAMGERQGLWVVADGGLWQMTAPTAQWTTLSCEILYGNRGDSQVEGAKPPRNTHTSTGLAFVQADGGVTRTAIAPFTEPPPWSADGADSVMGDFAQYHHPIAGLGSLIIVRSSSFSYECGAHGGVTADYLAYDVATGQAVSLVSQADALELGDELEASIRDALEARDGWVGEGGVELTGVYPRLAPDGLRADLQYTAGSCYACSDGAWHSYTVSTHVESPGLPPALAPFASPPPLVREVLPARDLPPTPDLPDEAFGWSEVPRTGSARQAVEAAFKAAPGAALG